MIRHGADTVFNSKDSMINEESVDEILARGEQKVWCTCVHLCERERELRGCIDAVTTPAEFNISAKSCGYDSCGMQPLAVLE